MDLAGNEEMTRNPEFLMEEVLQAEQFLGEAQPRHVLEEAGRDVAGGLGSHRKGLAERIVTEHLKVEWVATRIRNEQDPGQHLEDVGVRLRLELLGDAQRHGKKCLRTTPNGTDQPELLNGLFLHHGNTSLLVTVDS